MIRIVDNLMVALPVILLTIALLLACALAIALTRNAGIVRRGAASSSLSAVADDPFFYPFGEMPIVPGERHLAACDFRAWGIPDCSHSAGALRRNESGGRPASLSGTAVVLTFPQRRA